MEVFELLLEKFEVQVYQNVCGNEIKKIDYDDDVFALCSETLILLLLVVEGKVKSQIEGAIGRPKKRERKWSLNLVDHSAAKKSGWERKSNLAFSRNVLMCVCAPVLWSSAFSFSSAQKVIQ